MRKTYTKTIKAWFLRCVFGWENVSSIMALVQRGLHSDFDGCCQLLFHFFDECSDQSLHNLYTEIAGQISKKIVMDSGLIPPNYYTHAYPRNKDFVCKAFRAFSIVRSESNLTL